MRSISWSIPRKIKTIEEICTALTREFLKDHDLSDEKITSVMANHCSRFCVYQLRWPADITACVCNGNNTRKNINVTKETIRLTEEEWISVVSRLRSVNVIRNTNLIYQGQKL